MFHQKIEVGSGYPKQTLCFVGLSQLIITFLIWCNVKFSLLIVLFNAIRYQGGLLLKVLFISKSFCNSTSSNLNVCLYILYLVAKKTTTCLICFQKIKIRSIKKPAWHAYLICFCKKWPGNLIFFLKPQRIVVDY